MEASGGDPHHLDAGPDLYPACHFDADPDSDPACHFDPDPTPSFEINGSKPWKNAQIGSYSIHVGFSSANRCGSGPAYHFDADPDPVYHFDAVRIWILPLNLIRIRIYNTGKNIGNIQSLLSGSKIWNLSLNLSYNVQVL